ncbi:GntR family transcriptional regulator [Mesorhizobium sp.]|uniref:GntR family transcriptional regulator n=1 Tax=Mesorhizobium sp. TaxID=1871066 RepID=UPI000FE4F04E|nr:GntR family transcriptional regulator [Mesorhizobium sp.]RWD50750.1 MAG: GntR family transcriptional regulator [Mesorhizobium sp.]RWD96158.1 MAG: GntR family transcriptional regulator [Mesorhizobium sp.]
MLKKTRQHSKYCLERQSLPEALADSLRERILNGEFKVGDPLVQQAIAAEYGCSRMPVREAFRKLEAAGLIVFQIHKGAIVTSLPAAQILELFELRAMLECDILSRSLTYLSDENLARSEQILKDLGDAYHKRDMRKVGVLNWEFHRSLHLLPERAQTLALIQSINVQTERYRRLHPDSTSSFEDTDLEHHQILAMFKIRDSGVIDLMRDHITRTGHRLVEAL